MEIFSPSDENTCVHWMETGSKKFYDCTNDVMHFSFIYDPCDLETSLFFRYIFSLQGNGEKQGNGSEVCRYLSFLHTKSLTINNT